MTEHQCLVEAAQERFEFTSETLTTGFVLLARTTHLLNPLTAHPMQAGRSLRIARCAIGSIPIRPAVGLDHGGDMQRYTVPELYVPEGSFDLLDDRGNIHELPSRRVNART